MKINELLFGELTSLLTKEQLLNEEELRALMALAANDFPFANQLDKADSLHFHIHVKNTGDLPHELLLNHNGKVVNEAPGYIKYQFSDGLNFIFSHIPVAQKEKAVHACNDAYLDHIGIDIRSDKKEAYIVFQQIPAVAAQHDYLFSRQGDGREAVKCCHMQVKEKYWVYPDGMLNYEFAFGPLVIHEGGAFGADLRPANPYNKIEASADCCAATKPSSAIFIHS